MIWDANLDTSAAHVQHKRETKEEKDIVMAQLCRWWVKINGIPMTPQSWSLFGKSSTFCWPIPADTSRLLAFSALWPRSDQQAESGLPSPGTYAANACDQSKVICFDWICCQLLKDLENSGPLHLGISQCTDKCIEGNDVGFRSLLRGYIMISSWSQLPMSIKGGPNSLSLFMYSIAQVFIVLCIFVFSS